MRASWALLLLLPLAGCDDPPPLERSCAGEAIGLCGPAEWAEVVDASLTPDELTVADFSLRARVQAELARCDNAPAPHEVEIVGLVPGDAGASVRLMELAVVEDDDADGRIDVEIVNPFIATFPTREAITLRFTARSTTPGGCAGGAFEAPYRTGAARGP